MDAWLGPGPNGDQWRKYLHTDRLRSLLEQGSQADPAAASRVLQQFRTGAAGLERPQFERVRTALSQWLASLQEQYAGDLARLAWASRGDHTPITQEQFAEVRGELRSAAHAVEAELNRYPSVTAGWKKYLNWNDLQPHLVDGYRPTTESLAQLGNILQRLRANEAGLERPQFTRLARAIARYRALVTWAVTALSRDTRPIYERYLGDLQTAIERHQQRPSMETIRQIARLGGIVDDLGQSPELVRLLRERLAAPNIYADVSKALITRAPTRPVDRLSPVRDCILGTNIFGSAHTLGGVSYDLANSPNSISLAIHLGGEAHSQTRGYNGPVRINSTGRTTFWATSAVSLSDEAFVAAPATGQADTRTHIRSIQKTGGRFGARLIERIAWDRALEQKRQAERIASSHTRDRIVREFQETVERDLAAARARYEAQVRAPLTRRGATPEHLRMRSTQSDIDVEALFALRHQLGADGPPPPLAPGHDLAVQVHESAVNNYLPLVLASARISQQTAENPPKLEGNVPNWLKLLAVAQPDVAAAAGEAIETVQNATEAIQGAVGAEPAVTPPPFKPFSITLNSEAPVGVQFDNGEIAIRIRASDLFSDENHYRNWDIIVRYEILVDRNRILLERRGEIDALPTGFDPAWPRQLSAEETGFRSVLKKNMNARAAAGQSFPSTIPILPLRITQFGVLVLDEIRADDGWLTLRWRLP